MKMRAFWLRTIRVGCGGDFVNSNKEKIRERGNEKGTPKRPFELLSCSVN